LSEGSLRRAWRGRFEEGATILLSILLAFGIDAWWQARGDRLELSDYLGAIRAEMSANLSVLRADSVRLEYARRAQVRLLTATGPGAAALGEDSLAALVGAAFDGVPSTLTTGAMEAFLASEAFSRVPEVAFQAGLANWKGSYESLRRQSVVFQDGRTATVELLGGRLPLLDAARVVNPSLGGSSFSFDASLVLSDPTFEGLMANLAALSTRLGRDLSSLIALTEDFQSDHSR